MLGTGEQLRDANDVQFTFSPMDGDVVSPCSSILVTIEQRKCERSNSPDRIITSPHCSSTESRGELEAATNRGHFALSRYRKHGGRQNLERCIAEFERALNDCSLGPPYRAAAQSNLAMAKFILCQTEDTSASLQDPTSLYRSALNAHPVGHVDRPSTLIQLACLQN
ncbi:hypothetical protein EV363DRAFT_1344308 [Boletus edulis]|nr:hypothetical protein EV363DRAFT_1344308 [Boletus edulis]